MFACSSQVFSGRGRSVIFVLLISVFSFRIRSSHFSFHFFILFYNLKNQKKTTHTQNLGRSGKLFKNLFGRAKSRSVGQENVLKKTFRSGEISVGRLGKLFKKRFRSGEISVGRSVGKTFLKLFTFKKHVRSGDKTQSFAGGQANNFCLFLFGLMLQLGKCSCSKLMRSV